MVNCWVKKVRSKRGSVRDVTWCGCVRALVGLKGGQKGDKDETRMIKVIQVNGPTRMNEGQMKWVGGWIR